MCPRAGLAGNLLHPTEVVLVPMHLVVIMSTTQAIRSSDRREKPVNRELRNVEQ
jgi:hypothetical protein